MHVPESVISAAKFFDQPTLINSLRKKVPLLLTASGAALVAYDTYSAPPERRGKKFIKSASVAAATIAAALWGNKYILSPKGKDLREELVEESWQYLKKTGVKMNDAMKTIWKKGEDIRPRDLHEFNVEGLLNILKRESVPDGHDVIKLVNKAKTSVLNPAEVKRLRAAMAEISPNVDKLIMSKAKAGEVNPAQTKRLKVALAENSLIPDIVKERLNLVIPDPKDLSWQDMVGEIWDLSVMGLLPVLGGVVGGIAGNILTGDNSKTKMSNQAKEGFFQFVANIMLCNVGAFLMLAGLEKLPKALDQAMKRNPVDAKSFTQKLKPYQNSRGIRFVAMLVGILAFGVVGGSAISNFFGNNFINPLIDHGPMGAIKHLSDKIAKGGPLALFKGLYDERRPEPLDIALHIDDVATVGVLSGLKWVEPILPILYGISGVRSGIGYRNGHAVHIPVVKKKNNPRIYTQPTFASGPPVHFRNNQVFSRFQRQMR